MVNWQNPHKQEYGFLTAPSNVYVEPEVPQQTQQMPHWILQLIT